MTSRPEKPSVAERWEDALDVWTEYDWGSDADEVVAPQSCDLENPEICESCQ